MQLHKQCYIDANIRSRIHTVNPLCLCSLPIHIKTHVNSIPLSMTIVNGQHGGEGALSGTVGSFSAVDRRGIDPTETPKSSEALSRF